MQRTVELLKEKGIIEKIQKNFEGCKPPIGTTDETIREAIEFSLQHQMLMQGIEEEVFGAMFDDVIDAVRGEVSIEFVEHDVFVENARESLNRMTDAIIDDLRNRTGESNGEE